VCIARGEASFASTLGWGFKFWAISLPISMVWCGIATLISSLFKSPIVAMLVTFLVFGLLWLTWLIGSVGAIDPITYIYPNRYDNMLLHPHVHKFATGLGVCLAMAAAYVGVGSYLFQKKDV
jgi:putative exporter of polyketide antibiotics